MNESIHRKSAVASAVKDRETGSPMGVRCVVLFAVLVLASLPAIPFAQSSCPGIHVKVLNIRNSTGTVDCALFDSPVGFPVKALLGGPSFSAASFQYDGGTLDLTNSLPY